MDTTGAAPGYAATAHIDPGGTTATYADTTPAAFFNLVSGFWA